MYSSIRSLDFVVFLEAKLSLLKKMVHAHVFGKKITLLYSEYHSSLGDGKGAISDERSMM